MTQRFRFLSGCLRCFESGDSLELLNLANDFSMDTWDNKVAQLTEEDNQVWNDMVAELRDARGQELHDQRVSLGQRPSPDRVEIILKHRSRLSSEGRKVMDDALREVAASRESAPPPADDELAALDARYARELVNLIPEVVLKASTLQDLEIQRVPRPTVLRYFDEAHKCYFFGLNRACVTLCRAMLEAALKELLGSNNLPNELLDLARERAILDGERVNAAQRVFSAGNSAVHREDFFNQRYSDSDVEDILLHTRKILEDLYSPDQGT